MMKDDVEYNIKQHFLINKFDSARMPDLDKGKDDLNLNRVSPFLPINPFKAHYCNPYYSRPSQLRFNKPNFNMKGKR